MFLKAGLRYPQIFQNQLGQRVLLKLSSKETIDSNLLYEVYHQVYDEKTKYKKKLSKNYRDLENTARWNIAERLICEGKDLFISDMLKLIFVNCPNNRDNVYDKINILMRYLNTNLNNNLSVYSVFIKRSLLTENRALSFFIELDDPISLNSYSHKKKMEEDNEHNDYSILNKFIGLTIGISLGMMAINYKLWNSKKEGSSVLSSKFIPQENNMMTMTNYNSTVQNKYNIHKNHLEKKVEESEDWLQVEDWLQKALTHSDWSLNALRENQSLIT